MLVEVKFLESKNVHLKLDFTIDRVSFCVWIFVVLLAIRRGMFIIGITNWGKQSLSLFVPVYGLAGNRIFGPKMADTNGDLVEKVGHFEPDFHGFWGFRVLTFFSTTCINGDGPKLKILKHTKSPASMGMIFLKNVTSQFCGGNFKLCPKIILSFWKIPMLTFGKSG